MIDPAQARKDLEEKPPDVWARLYGARLLDDLEEARQQRLRTAAMLQKQNDRVGQLRRALRAILGHVRAFERATGWSRQKPEKRLPTTQKRWQAAQVFARACEETISKLFDSIVPPGADGKSTGGRFAEILSKVSELAEVVKSGDKEKIREALSRMVDEAEPNAEKVSSGEPVN